MDNTFQWTDSLVKEAFDSLNRRYITPSLYNEWKGIDSELEAFKQSKQTKRDWEILSLKDYKNEGEYYRQLKSGFWSNSVINNRYRLGDLLKSNYPIHSVRRFSDNKILTLGDNTVMGNIEAFILSDTGRLTVKLSTGAWQPFEIVQTIPKEPVPLFTTEDGVAIFSGNKYWSCPKDLSNPRWYYADNTGVCGIKQFSTKETATQYILENKPVLSYKDINVFLFKTENINSEKLKELVKSKING